MTPVLNPVANKFVLTEGEIKCSDAAVLWVTQDELWLANSSCIPESQRVVVGTRGKEMVVKESDCMRHSGAWNVDST